MSAIKLVVTAIGVAMTISRHPVVRAGLKAAPLLATPQARAVAARGVKVAAYNAGVLARKIVPRSLIE